MDIKTRLLVGVLKMTRFPQIPSNPKTGKWYGIPLKGCVSSDGKEVHAGFRKGTENKLVILLFGGGVSWNEFMAARPNSVYGNPDKISFYACGDGGLVADLAARIGIHTLSKKESNPFRNWNMLAVPYTTGDFHCGAGDFPYTALDGSKQVLHHHGYTNYRAALQETMKHIGHNPEQILVTGFSAGGFGTALLTDDVMRTFPNCSDVTSYVDSGFMIYPGWPEVARNVWKAPKEIAERIHSDNITLDCLQALKQDHGDRVKIAFSCSTRDAALSEYINYVEKDQLYADKESGIKFQKELKQMCDALQQAIPNIALYIFDTPDENAAKKAEGLTKHCIGAADKMVVEGITAAQWLWDAVCGNPKQIGLSLLDQIPE
mgnify:FL=1